MEERSGTRKDVVGREEGVELGEVHPLQTDAVASLRDLRVDVLLDAVVAKRRVGDGVAGKGSPSSLQSSPCQGRGG